MLSTDSLTNHILVAMPGLDDPRFERSVVLICEHNKEGALGIVINRLAGVTFADLLNYLGRLDKKTQAYTMDAPVLWGGPMERDRGFVVHRSVGQWKHTFMISEDIALTTSQDILESLSRQEGPKDALIAFGCARWAAGQLEQEIADNVWLTLPTTETILFDCPINERWLTSAALIGIDFNRLSYEMGHA